MPKRERDRDTEGIKTEIVLNLHMRASWLNRQGLVLDFESECAPTIGKEEKMSSVQIFSPNDYSAKF